MASVGSSNYSQRTVDEYVVKVPKNPSKKYNVMRFGGGDMMDIQKWNCANISRDMSGKRIYQEDEVYPEFGAGSEYGRKRKEEARKLKYGLKLSKFNVEDQPWNLSVVTTAKAPYSVKAKNKDNMVTVTKEFDGRKEGGIGEGSMYFVFFQCPNNTFEAYPVDSWYNFTRKIKHRTLTDEEAEAEWDKRDKILNHLNFMARKRLRIDDEKEAEEDEVAGKKKTGSNKGDKSGKAPNPGLLIHDEPDTDNLLMSESDDNSDEDKDKKIKKSKKQKGVKHDAPDEALEESDDGDEEGQEQDYNSDKSSEEETANDSNVAPKGLDEEKSSSSSEEEEEPNVEEGKQKNKKTGSGDEISTSGESDVDSDIESSALFMSGRKTPTKGKKSSGNNTIFPTPNTDILGNAGTKRKLQEVAHKLESSVHSPPKTRLLGKRHAVGESIDISNVKRQKIGGSGSGSSTPTKDMSSKSQNVLNEETVRRYLHHKPITPKDLLKKFKTKKTGLTSEQIVNTVAAILKRLNPEQKKMNGKMHLFLKQS